MEYITTPISRDIQTNLSTNQNSKWNILPHLSVVISIPILSPNQNSKWNILPHLSVVISIPILSPNQNSKWNILTHLPFMISHLANNLIQDRWNIQHLFVLMAHPIYHQAQGVCGIQYICLSCCFIQFITSLRGDVHLDSFPHSWNY